MAEQPAQQPQPQPPVGPGGPPGPEGRPEQGNVPQTPQPGVGGAVEPSQPTEGAGVLKPGEKEEQERLDREIREQASKDAAPEMNQNHDVHVGDKVQLNGTLFNVSSGQYDWTCKGPDGETVPLTNPTMPGPSFTATQEGAYVSKLTTDDGIATITVNASDPDDVASPLTDTSRVPLHSGGTLVGPSLEEEQRRQAEAQGLTGQPGQQGQTVEQRQALEAQRQTPRHPGETEAQHQERVRQEAEQRRQQSQPRPGETPEQHQERLRREEQERQQQAAQGTQD